MLLLAWAALRAHGSCSNAYKEVESPDFPSRSSLLYADFKFIWLRLFSKRALCSEARTVIHGQLGFCRSRNFISTSRISPSGLSPSESISNYGR
jgi:hypothetical protein